MQIAVLSLPNSEFFVGLGPWTRLATQDEAMALALDRGGSFLYTNDFFSKSDTPLLVPESSKYFNDISSLDRFLMGFWPAYAHAKPDDLKPLSFEAPSKEIFSHDFAAIQNRIKLGLLDKAVPTTFERAALSPNESHEVFDAYSLKRALNYYQSLSAKQQSMLYLFALLGSEHSFLGLSPELLFTSAAPYQAGYYLLMALAGSAKLDRPSEDFLGDPKERAEHDWVIQDLSQQSKLLGAEIQVGETALAVYPKLQHLKTPISLRFKMPPQASVHHTPFGFHQKIQHFHPTAALGVLPRSPASTQFLSSLVGAKERGMLGAAFGLCDVKRSLEHAVVVIRGFERRQNTVWLGAGCGIVAQSQLEREWAELQLKRASIKAIFGWT